MKTSCRRILGIDPGYGRMGWAIIDVDRSVCTRIASGCFSTPAAETPAQRVVYLFERLSVVVKKHQPTEAAMEKLFFQKNVTTAIGVGQARGMALLVFGQNKLTVHEFTPSDVKLATTGYGRADKRQMGQMVKILLKLPSIPTSDDEADALAIALCAAAHRPTHAT
jgi:crossover junction endodeoxyribonuclease RuvC